MTIISTTVGKKESLRRKGVAIIVNKRVWHAVLRCNLKNDRMISVCFQGKPFTVTVIQVNAPATNTEEVEVEWFYDDLQDLLELTRKKKKRCPFHCRELECQSRKSRDTWSDRQVWPWSTKWSRARQTEFCQENALVIANALFQQHKRWLYTWTSADGWFYV